MTLDLDDLPWVDPDWPPSPAVEREPRKCRRHEWVVIRYNAMPGDLTPEDFADHEWKCARCGRVRDEVKARRGKNSRDYGNRAELAVARTYGGTKIGHAGGPVDVRGEDWNTQVKTHRRKPPVEWVKAFGAMAANRERMPRLLLRFVGPGGVAPDDYFVVRGSDWLAWHGKDESS